MDDDLKRKAIVVRDSLTEFIAAAEDAKLLRKRVVEQDLKIGGLKGRVGNLKSEIAGLGKQIRTMRAQNHETKPRISEVFQENQYLRKKIAVVRGFAELVSKLNSEEGLNPTGLWHLVRAAERTLGKTEEEECEGCRHGWHAEHYHKGKGGCKEADHG